MRTHSYWCLPENVSCRHRTWARIFMPSPSSRPLLLFIHFGSTARPQATPTHMTAHFSAALLIMSRKVSHKLCTHPKFKYHVTGGQGTARDFVLCDSISYWANNTKPVQLGPRFSWAPVTQLPSESSYLLCPLYSAPDKRCWSRWIMGNPPLRFINIKIRSLIQMREPSLQSMSKCLLGLYILCYHVRSQVAAYSWLWSKSPSLFCFPLTLPPPPWPKAIDQKLDGNESSESMPRSNGARSSDPSYRPVAHIRGSCSRVMEGCPPVVWPPPQYSHSFITHYCEINA